MGNNTMGADKMLFYQKMIIGKSSESVFICRRLQFNEIVIEADHFPCWWIVITVVGFT